MTTATPSFTAPLSSPTPGFGSLLQSEWTKLRSVRSTWILVSLAIGLSIGFSTVIAIITGLTFDSLSDGIKAEFDPILTTLGGWLFGLILVTVLGANGVSSEYSSRMIRTTLIITPQRNRVFAAKAIVTGLLGLAVTVIVIPGMFFISQPIYRFYDLETASVTDSDVIRYLIVATLLHGLIHSLIPFSIAWLLRSTAGAITASIGLAVFPWMITPLVPLWVKENVLRYFPDTAKDSLIGQLEPGAAVHLGDTAAIIVIAVWIVGLLSAAAFIVNRRDV